MVIQSLLKETAQTQQVDLAAKQRFKVVVINEAEHLSRDAQAALRRTMEKYSPNLRLILVANSTANIIPPIKSRTLLVRVAAPTSKEIVSILKHTSIAEKVEFKEKLATRIAEESGRNLRRALLMLEAVYAQKYIQSILNIRRDADRSTISETVKDTTPIPPPDYEALIAQIADEILAEHTPARFEKYPQL